MIFWLFFCVSASIIFAITFKLLLKYQDIIEEKILFLFEKFNIVENSPQEISDKEALQHQKNTLPDILKDVPDDIISSKAKSIPSMESIQITTAELLRYSDSENVALYAQENAKSSVSYIQNTSSLHQSKKTPEYIMPKILNVTPISSIHQVTEELLQYIHKDKLGLRLNKKYIVNEESFDKNIPVWGGIICFGLTIFCIIQYLIDNNKFTEDVQLIMCAVFGASLISIVDLTTNRNRQSDIELSELCFIGTGLIMAYIILLSVAKNNPGIPTLIILTAIGGVTGLNFIMSLRYGLPIAVIGAIGSLLTPIVLFTQNQSHVEFLFGYLYVIFLMWI